jgi:hypothetical protein
LGLAAADTESPKGPKVITNTKSGKVSGNTKLGKVSANIKSDKRPLDSLRGPPKGGRVLDLRAPSPHHLMTSHRKAGFVTYLVRSVERSENMAGYLHVGSEHRILGQGFLRSSQTSCSATSATNLHSRAPNLKVRRRGEGRYCSLRLDERNPKTSFFRRVSRRTCFNL